MRQSDIDWFSDLWVAIFPEYQDYILPILSLEISVSDDVLTFVTSMSHYGKLLIFCELLELLFCGVHYLTCQIDVYFAQIRRHLELQDQFRIVGKTQVIEFLGHGEVVDVVVGG